MKTSIIKTLIAGLVLCHAGWANADDMHCMGKINNAWVNQNGDFIFQGTWQNSPVAACNIKATWKSVDPAICRSWQVIVFNALNKGLTVDIDYPAGSAPSCAEIPVLQSAPSPWYVRLLDF